MYHGRITYAWSKKYWVFKVEGLASAIGLIKMGLLNGLPIEADEIGPLFIEMASILIFLSQLCHSETATQFLQFCQPINHHVGVFGKVPKTSQLPCLQMDSGICTVCRICPLTRQWNACLLHPLNFNVASLINQTYFTSSTRKHYHNHNSRLKAAYLSTVCLSRGTCLLLACVYNLPPKIYTSNSTWLALHKLKIGSTEERKKKMIQDQAEVLIITTYTTWDIEDEPDLLYLQDAWG